MKPPIPNLIAHASPQKSSNGAVIVIVVIVIVSIAIYFVYKSNKKNDK
jgi:CDP-diglyceride synthetase